jgi:hypothetical protein
MASNPFFGRWRIVHTSMWDCDALDCIAPAHLTFKQDGLGELHFIAVDGDVDHRLGERAGRLCIEFSWEGFDDRDPACGRGWAILTGDDIQGEIFIHRGDGSTFRAEREPVKERPQSPAGRRR